MQKSMSLKAQLLEHLGKLANEREISDLAERSGVEQSSISRAKAGKQNLGLDKVSLLLEALGAQITFPDEAEESPPTIRRMGTHSPVEFVEGELISVPVFEKAGAGPAMDFFSATPDTVIRVPKKYGIHDVAAIEVTGDSMEPIIHKGAHVGVIPLDGDLQEGNIYLCRRPPFGLLVKRVLMGNNGQILLRSENPKYPDQTVEYNEYEQFIVGRVVWVLQLM